MRGRPSPLEEDDRWARVAWTYLAEPRSPTLQALLDADGPVASLATLRRGEILARALEVHPKCHPADLDGWTARLDELDLDGMARACEVTGLTVLVPGDEWWPEGREGRMAVP